MSFTVDRRNFLRFTAGGAVGVATSGVTLRGISELNAALSSEEVRVPSGPEQWKPGICWLCPAGCGLRVRMVGERAVKIQGNPLNPMNHGGLCPKGVAGLQALYHPDRITSPLKNVGKRERPRWQEITWEEATTILASQLRQLRDSGEPRGLALIDRAQDSLRGRLLREFLASYGSPNYLTLSSGLDALQAAVFLQQGVTQPVAYDLENTRYVMSFGVNLLEGWGAPVSIMRAFGRWRDASAGRRSKFVQIESRFSPTAAKADQWVALRPGTEAALALGIAHVLISEGLYDATFVRERTFGFEDWTDKSGQTHTGFRSLITSEYRLNQVSEITGVPPEIIVRLAREFGQNRPAIAIGDRQTSTLTGNPYAAMAVHSLNALVGSIDALGGVLIQPEGPTRDGEQDSAARSAGDWIDARPEYLSPGHHVSRLPEAILSGKPYPLRALLLHEVDPVFAEANGSAFREAFRSVPFIASFTTFMNDSASLADLVLPAATGLERWQEATSPATFPYVLHAVSPPAVAARHGSRDPVDVVLGLAAALGGPPAAALPYPTFEEYLHKQAEKIFAAQTGSVFAPAVEQAWDRLLEASGWWAPSYSSADELWEQMKERGGWWEPTYYYGEWNRVCRTPSGRFEFYSQRLAAWSSRRKEFAQAAGLPPGDDRLSLPHQPALPQPPDGYPLLLMPIEVLPLAGGEGTHMPYLQQIAGEHVFAHWDSWLEINPHTARNLGINDRDLVWVESSRGRVQARARLYAGVRPETVHLPMGYGHTAGPEWQCRGVNPLTIMEAGPEPVAGLPQTGNTFVKVYRA